MMKKLIQAFFQRMLGFQNYLYVFSLFKIYTLRWDRPDQEGDFNFFLTLLQPHFHILDIGANIGIMSVLMAKRAPKGKVYAFEPVPDNFQALQRVVKFHDLSHVEMFPVALGTESQKIQMQMPIMQGVQMQGLSHVAHESIDTYEANYQHYEVDQWVLDKLDFFTHTAIHAIKIDVENYEQFVFQGGKELIARDKPMIYCELWPNENRQACFDLLTSLGYRIFVKEKERLKAFDAERDTHHNFFFMP